MIQREMIQFPKDIQIETCIFKHTHIERERKKTYIFIKLLYFNTAVLRISLDFTFSK